MTKLEQLEALVERLIEGLCESELDHLSTAFYWTGMARTDYEREYEKAREERNKNLAEWNEIKIGLIPAYDDGPIEPDEVNIPDEPSSRFVCFSCGCPKWHEIHLTAEGHPYHESYAETMERIVKGNM